MSVLLVIGYVWPEPKSSAAGWRMLSLLRLFREQGWRIIFACAAEPSVHRFQLAQWGIEEQAIAVNDEGFSEQLACWRPDVVMFDRFMLEEQFGWKVDLVCPNALKILDSEDLHCWRASRAQAYREQRTWQLSDLHQELTYRELAAIYRCDLTLTISEAEMELLQQLGVPSSLLLYCPLLVDGMSHHAALFASRQGLVFIGNFRHEPNWHTVLRLKALWQEIRKQLPGIEINIYGAYPPPKATALHAPKQGFHIGGWADDAQQVIAQARLLVAPIPFGAGLKGKILDAMQCKTPVVSSSIGAEGFSAADFPGLICETDEAFVQAVVQLYRDEQQWLLYQARCEQALQPFLYAQHAARLWQQISTLLQQLRAHRLLNFTGAMLKQQQFRSTQYMGQWIEAKNKLKHLLENDDAAG